MKSTSFNTIKLSAFLSFFLLITIVFESKSQYYSIPDPAFSSYLANTYPTIMFGTQLDTTHPDLQIITRMNACCWNITNFDGIQYFNSLQTLFCNNNLLTTLSTLPNSLDSLKCSGNQLTSLPELPSSLLYLDCNNNLLTSLPLLPNSLTKLLCVGNQITLLPTLPNSLSYLECRVNGMISLPTLPSSMDTLYCSENNLTSLPTLPDSLSALYVHVNQLLLLPSIPALLTDLTCSNNQLNSLPFLPNTIKNIDCSYNQIQSLPALPNSLKFLMCDYNLLTELPTLPNSLLYLYCSNNQITCFERLPPLSGDISNNPYSCIPNITSYTPLFTPICETNDLINNPNNCTSLSGILGKILQENNTNCTLDSVETGAQNILVKLYDNFSNLVASTYSDINGYYFFQCANGTFTVELDTTDQVYSTNCAVTNSITLVQELIENVNFFIDCNSETDLAITNVLDQGIVFPGQIHQLQVFGGNINSNYSASCLDTTAGTVIISVDGPVNVDSFSGLFSPTLVNGNTFTYEIADFSEVGIYDAFEINFLTDTTAQAGDSICVTVSITTLANDINIINNIVTDCYQVINSYDPNNKEVSISEVPEGFDDFLTYTIQFQNTGTAPAINIRLEDTLSNSLNFETFELVQSSHPVITSLYGDRLVFRFNNIQLADSLSDEPASHGFVQYRIKPISGLPAGTVIPNTASIYFDYNAPIVTNTATTTFPVLSVNDLTEKIPVIYPNPSSGFYSMKSAESISEISVYNLTGEQILQQQTTQSTISIDLSNQPAGVYLLKTNDVNQMHYIRLVKL